ncbi:uncharacterized protein ARMOST_13471 [Armillaria ostoyae]|uniref:Uncharacterized protein n=1 Tax=Armillaria ostoyae TaxID=47428 RepID=A0A284RMU7_ARMOS|nr:uncharacterized protein ARMOST_13471 [Armillaria ostoyae]
MRWSLVAEMIGPRRTAARAVLELLARHLKASYSPHSFATSQQQPRICPYFMAHFVVTFNKYSVGIFLHKDCFSGTSLRPRNSCKDGLINGGERMAGTAAMPAPSVTDVYQYLSLPFFAFTGFINRSPS